MLASWAFAYFMPLLGIAFGLSLVIPYFSGAQKFARRDQLSEAERLVAPPRGSTRRVVSPRTLTALSHHTGVKVVYVGRFVLEVSQLLRDHPDQFGWLERYLLRDASLRLARVPLRREDLKKLKAVVLAQTRD